VTVTDMYERLATVFTQNERCLKEGVTGSSPSLFQNCFELL